MPCVSAPSINNANDVGRSSCNGSLFSHVLSYFDLTLFDEHLPGQDSEAKETSLHATSAFQLPRTEFSETNTAAPFPYDHCRWSCLSADACSGRHPLTVGVPSVDSTVASLGGTQQGHFNAAVNEDGACVPRLNAQENSPVEYRRLLIAPRLLKIPTKGKQRVYEWEPQTDRKLEKKRRRAIKAYQNREKISQREIAIHSETAKLAEVIEGLQRDILALKHRISAVRKKLSAPTPKH